MIITILVFILILSVLVLIHEAGHFFVARKFGIKVEEFGFGFPPRAFGIKRGETTYSINWLPIGGFVKLYGEDEAGGGKVSSQKSEVRSFDKSRAFFAKPAWQRFLVVISGVGMNFILSVIIISFLFSVVGVSIPGNKVVVVGIAKGSPAFAAGIKAGDIIDSFNNTQIKNPQELIQATKKHLGEQITLKIKSDGAERSIQIVPRKEFPKNEGSLGVSISPNLETKKHPWYKAPFLATREALNQSWLIIKGFGSIIFELFVHGTVPAGVAGPVGIAQLTGQFVKVGAAAVFSLVSLISLNLAVLNILPIPALDGGRLSFILIEIVSGKKINRKFEGYAHAIGMVLLLTLIAFITFKDVVRIFTGQPLLSR